MSNSIHAVMVKKARECNHLDKAPFTHPQGATVCIGCAIEGAMEFFTSGKHTNRDQFVTGPLGGDRSPEGEGPDEHPLEWYLR